MDTESRARLLIWCLYCGLCEPGACPHLLGLLADEGDEAARVDELRAAAPPLDLEMFSPDGCEEEGPCTTSD